MDKKSKIILTRRFQWINGTRAYRVYIDGVERGQIRNGSSEEFVLSEGAHQVHCRMAWYASRDFTVHLGPGDVEYLMVKSAMKYYWPLILSMIIGILINIYYGSWKLMETPQWLRALQFVLIVPGLLYYLYYLTVARNRCLLIEQDKENVFAN